MKITKMILLLLLISSSTKAQTIINVTQDTTFASTLVVTGNLIIQGTGNPKVTFAGNPKFDIQNGATLKMQNFNLTHYINWGTVTTSKSCIIWTNLGDRKMTGKMNLNCGGNCCNL